MRKGHLITFDYHGPIDALIDYIVKCIKTPLDFTVSCTLGLEAVQSVKEAITEYITFLSHTGRTDIIALTD
jgi:hypothetical protein